MADRIHGGSICVLKGREFPVESSRRRRGGAYACMIVPFCPICRSASFYSWGPGAACVLPSTSYMVMVEASLDIAMHNRLRY